MGDVGSIPGSGRSPGGGHGNPLQYSCLENPWTEKSGRLQSIGSQSQAQLKQLSMHAACSFLMFSVLSFNWTPLTYSWIFFLYHHRSNIWSTWRSHSPIWFFPWLLNTYHLHSSCVCNSGLWDNMRVTWNCEDATGSRIKVHFSRKHSSHIFQELRTFKFKITQQV